MAETLASYDAVFVVSDLHLGGYTAERHPDGRNWVPVANEPSDVIVSDQLRNLRIFRDGPALAWAIQDCAKFRGRVALVINGDIVDFLADPRAVGFETSPDLALAKLQRAVNDPQQRMVWDALCDFVAADRGDLVLILGNHDLELALPRCREYLMTVLTNGKKATRRRVRMVYEPVTTSGRRYRGPEHRCTVGGAVVCCVHGNEADAWNRVDYGALHLVAQALDRGTAVPGMPVTAGSDMVVRYMNEVKQRYQWIDLLKPEREGASLVLTALVPGMGPKLSNLAAAVKLGGGGVLRELAISAPPIEPKVVLSEPEGRAPRVSGDDLLRAAYQRVVAGHRPLDLLAPEAQGALSAVMLAPHLARLKVAGLRDALAKSLAHDASFDPTVQDDLIDDLDQKMDPEIDFLVAGHTHLEKSLPRPKGGAYFNSGTWIKLVQVPERALSPQIFPEVERRLRDGALEALDGPIDVPGGGTPVQLLRSIRTVVRIAARSGGSAVGELFHVDGTEQQGFSMTAVRKTRRARNGKVTS